MASQPSWPTQTATFGVRERPAMTLLPDLTDDEREELERRREDAARDARLSAAILEMKRNQREAQQLLATLEQELRFPLESVRVEP